MTTRPEGLKLLAGGTRETLVAVTNHARSMTAPEVPAPYNTTLGRGHRHVRLRAEWLCSTFLAMVLDDPKNAAWQVPACGDLPVVDRRLVKHHSQTEGNALNRLGPTVDTTSEVQAFSIEPWIGSNLFKVLVNIVSTVALDWGGPVHRKLRRGFNVTISPGMWMYAEIREFYDFSEDGSMTWRRISFQAPIDPDIVLEDSAVTPIRRQAIIQREHIELLAMLYAETLKYEGAQLLATPSETAPAPADADAETENAGSPGRDPAPSDCQLSELVTDGDKHTQANGPCKPGSKLDFGHFRSCVDPEVRL